MILMFIPYIVLAARNGNVKRNRTRTETETETETKTATLLVHGRPQAGKVSAGGMRYYVVRPDSDTARLTVTLTKTVGEGDLYMVRRNGTTVIDPLDDTTFRYRLSVCLWARLTIVPQAVDPLEDTQGFGTDLRAVDWFHLAFDPLGDTTFLVRTVVCA